MILYVTLWYCLLLYSRSDRFSAGPCHLFAGVYILPESPSGGKNRRILRRREEKKNSYGKLFEGKFRLKI